MTLQLGQYLKNTKIKRQVSNFGDFNEFFLDKIKASSRELIQEINSKEHITPQKGDTCSTLFTLLVTRELSSF